MKIGEDVTPSSTRKPHSRNISTEVKVRADKGRKYKKIRT